MGRRQDAQEEITRHLQVEGRPMIKRRGTEAFPDLGAHCDEPDFNQLNFLPFECDGCGGFFYAAHRVYWDHDCAKAADQGRTVVVCPDCGDAIERQQCRGRRATRRSWRRTRGTPASAKGCSVKVCLKHWFPADHSCAAAAAGARRAAGTARCGHDVKKQGGCRTALVVSARSFKIC
ncbi:LOW QUALITY PROTEIN: hypothetical protein BDA96_04G094000 [Sorghum bicolor]|uniref:AN1-type domain-containing protein n=1 Tax=Sorghum bicolor TaxID=4558 RepID=A0A921UHI6_SORBI|nr:LOW QUALITY PROTEIN: hypothetical protein BDA96_04G094000 [Sorghum bicolor]